MTTSPSDRQPPGPAPEPAAGATNATGTSTGLDPQLSGLLTYALGWVTGLIFFLVEKEHREVRFHAAQSILVSLVLIAVSMVLSMFSMIPVIGLLAILGLVVLGIGGFALWVYLLIQGYNLNHVRLPVIGAFAEQWAAR
jgi:uncharacterized membrane protein